MVCAPANCSASPEAGRVGTGGVGVELDSVAARWNVERVVDGHGPAASGDRADFREVEQLVGPAVTVARIVRRDTVVAQVDGQTRVGEDGVTDHGGVIPGISDGLNTVGAVVGDHVALTWCPFRRSGCLSPRSGLERLRGSPERSSRPRRHRL